MWKSVPLEFDVIDFEGVQIKIEKPIHAVRAKEQYLKSLQLANKEKHEADLKEIYSKNPEYQTDDIPF